MTSNSHVNIGMAIASREEVVHDLRKNTPSLLLVAGVTLAYVLVSAGLFRYVESRPWSFGEALYFTALNVFSGNFQLGYEPTTALGRLIGVVNPLAGLILFGIFIAILTMIFQPSEWSLKGKAELFAQGGSVVLKPSTPLGDDLAKDLNDALAKAAQRLADRESEGKDLGGLGEVATRLRAQLEDLQQAQQDFDRAEQRLREVKKQTRTQLTALPFHLGTDRDLPTGRRAEFRKP